MQREETAIKHKPNTLLLSTQAAYAQSVKYNDTLTREFNVFRGGDGWGPKIQNPQPLSHWSHVNKSVESLHIWKVLKTLKREKIK